MIISQTPLAHLAIFQGSLQNCLKDTSLFKSLDFKTLFEQYHPRDQTSVPAFPSSSLNKPTYVSF